MADCEKGVFKQVPADALQCAFLPVQAVWQSPATATVGDWLLALGIVGGSMFLVLVVFGWIAALTGK